MELGNALDLNKIKKEKNETVKFMKELEKSLNTKDSIYEQIMEEQELAFKYKGQIKELIKECMRDISYDEPFKYIEYNQRSNKYYIYDFNQGKFKRNLTTLDDLKKNNLNIGNIYTIENDKLKRDLAVEYLVKDKVSYALWDLEEDA